MAAARQEGAASRVAAEKTLLPFGWVWDGRTAAPLRRNRVALATTPAAAARWNDEVGGIANPGNGGDFHDYALLAVFYAGDHPAVRITRVIRLGNELAIALAVAPSCSGRPGCTPSPNGSFEIVAVPKREVVGVKALRVFSVEEKPLAEMTWWTPGATSSDPGVVTTSVRPRAGHVFTGVVASFVHPSSFFLTGSACRATIGGHWEDVGEFKQLVGGTPLRPILRRTYDAQGFVKTVSCGWRIPHSAAGKLLALEENNCVDDCQTGLMLSFVFAGLDQERGGEGWSSSSQSWIVRR